MKLCKICKKEFKPKVHNGTLCSDKCKYQNKKLVMKSFKKRNPTYFDDYREENEKRLLEYSQKWYEANRERKIESNKEWRESNTERVKEKSKNYYLINKEKLIEQARIYSLKRRNSDPIYKIRKNLRKRFHCALKGNQKSGSAVKDLGCSIEEFKIYLESQFEPWMNWDNYGKEWQIDHIRPLFKFDLTDPEQLKEACCYINLQPISKEEHKIKSALERSVRE